ncbi:universal stress protein [Pseudomonadota bacterium]
MIKTMLTATDGSSHANKAIDLAIDLATRYDARLVIVHSIGEGTVPDSLIHMAEVEHIVDPKPVAPALPRASIPHGDTRRWEESGKIHAFIANKLLSNAESEAKEKGVREVKTVAVQGDPASRILETVKSEGADMVVMGSRGLGNLKGLLQGSVSTKVSHLAECTCVCVK